MRRKSTRSVRYQTKHRSSLSSTNRLSSRNRYQNLLQQYIPIGYSAYQDSKNNQSSRNGSKNSSYSRSQSRSRVLPKINACSSIHIDQLIRNQYDSLEHPSIKEKVQLLERYPKKSIINQQISTVKKLQSSQLKKCLAINYTQ